jgi:two-component system response regulator HydG
VGLLNQASGGTLLLDEVGDLPLDVQAKLLRALQQRAARPLGSREEVPFDARIVATTRLNLADEVRRGSFREDLYFRLKVLSLHLPPLRQRGYDILLLARHFLERAGSSTRPLRGMTTAAAHLLLGHDWPGNVRELEHSIMAAAAAARYDHLKAVDLPLGAAQQFDLGGSMDSDTIPLSSWSEVERSHILAVVKSVAGNKVLAAKLLGLDRKTLARKLRRYHYAGVASRAPLESRPDLS